MNKSAALCLALLLLAVPLTGCQKSAAPDAGSVAQHSADTVASTPSKAESLAKLDDYLVSVKEQSNALYAFLENEAMTQTDMNLKTQEICELWDAALNHVLVEAKNLMPADEWAKLADEQNTWAEEKQAAIEAAAKEFEGGSLYALTVNTESSRLTEERVDALNQLLK